MREKRNKKAPLSELPIPKLKDIIRSNSILLFMTIYTASNDTTESKRSLAHATFILGY